MFFEPFGQRVQGDGSPIPANYTPPVDLGFTGHNHDDDVGLINMRGRIFDPAIRRFLTADPYVSQPLFGQNYNRYSYTNNSPLNFRDPTGFTGQEAETKSPRVELGQGKLTVRFDAGPKGIMTSRGKAPAKPGSSTPSAKPAAADANGSNAPTGAAAPASQPSGAAPAAEAEQAEGSLKAESWKDGTAVQAGGGFVAGMALGAVPFGGLAERVASAAGALPQGTKAAQIGKSLGEIVGGLGLAFVGAGGTVAGIGVSTTGIGAAIGVPAIVASSSLVVAGLASAAAGVQGLAVALTTGGGGGGEVQGGDTAWQRQKVGSKECQSGCEETARRIQQSIGGTIRVIRSRGPGAPMLGGVRDMGGGPFKNPAGNTARGWAEHQVVVKDGMVYDSLTGPEGQSIPDYKARWEFQDAIDFGF